MRKTMRLLINNFNLGAATRRSVVREAAPANCSKLSNTSKRVLITQEVFECIDQVATIAFTDLQYLGNPGNRQIGIGGFCQGNKENAIGEIIDELRWQLAS